MLCNFVVRTLQYIFKDSNFFSNERIRKHPQKFNTLHPKFVFSVLSTGAKLGTGLKTRLGSSTCALRGFFWLLSHVIYLKLTRELQECLLSQASIFE